MARHKGRRHKKVRRVKPMRLFPEQRSSEGRVIYALARTTKGGKGPIAKRRRHKQFAKHQKSEKPGQIRII